jgi:bifunctional enzyme CysN/CysC
MAHTSDLIGQDIEAYLHQHQHKGLLRFITCGSVDDGKSTLIGRLLYDRKMIFEDQLQALEADSKRIGTQGQEIDFALLVDGLAAEREQGITIDVAYRFFSTDRRKFIVADTPGHEQYTRNMVTGASTADVAVVLVDARKGVLTQTRRHSYLVHLMGIRHVVLAINKMDMVDYSQARFEAIKQDYLAFASQLPDLAVKPIPMSALKGDNINTPSHRMPWFHGSTLLGYLETVALLQDRLAQLPFRMPAQWINRSNQDFRGISGTIASGQLRAGDTVRVQPSGREVKVARIVTQGGDLDHAVAGQAVTLTLADEVDVSRGDMLSAPQAPATVADQLQAHVVWMAAEALSPGRNYWLKCGTQIVGASVTRIKHLVNVNTLEHMAAEKLDLNMVAECNLATDKPLVFDTYADNSATGGFVLIDRISHQTVGAGVIDHALRRAHNVMPQYFEVNKAARAALNQQRPCVLWFTGLSGSGKSTIANALEKQLYAQGRRTYVLDGDNVRHGLNKDLGFTQEDRIENIRRVAEVAKLMVDAGLIVITTFISPYRADRAIARSLFAPGEFFEVFVDTPVELCQQRDPKGLYKKARRGEIKNFTGIDSAFEAPQEPEVHLNAATKNVEECAAEVLLAAALGMAIST